MKYLLKHKKITGSIMFTYDDQGRIIAFAFDCEISNEIWDFIMDHFPTRIETLQHKAYKNFQLIEVPMDVSFDAFWNVYAYKVGNKERARKLYNVLEDNIRVQIFAAIKKYNTWLSSKKSIEKLYPETFLNQRRWENSFD